MANEQGANMGDQSDVDMAQLKEQMRAVAGDVSDIKSALKELVQLDKTLAELSIHNQNTQKTITMLWEKHDAIKTWQTQHELDMSRNKVEAEKDLDKVADKVEEWINKGKGALWVAGIFIGVIQISIVASIGWVFTHLSAAEQMNVVQQLKIEQLEKQTNERKETP